MLAKTLAPVALALVLALPAHTQEVAAGQTADADARNAVPFRPSPLQPGTLRIWGQEQMSAVVKYWTEGFREFHPEIVIEPRLMGSASAVPGLYAGLADIALLGRKNNITDDNGFSRPKGYTFQRFELMRGSLDVEGKSPALAVLVNRDNPVSKLTLRQLAAIAGCSCREGVREARTWGQLGALLDKARAVHLGGTVRLIGIREQKTASVLVRFGNGDTVCLARTKTGQMIRDNYCYPEGCRVLM